jgi:hypothetical protein
MNTHSHSTNACSVKSSRGKDLETASAQSPLFGSLCEHVDKYGLYIAIIVLLLPGSLLFLPLVWTYYAKRATKR